MIYLGASLFGAHTKTFCLDALDHASLVLVVTTENVLLARAEVPQTARNG